MSLVVQKNSDTRIYLLKNVIQIITNIIYNPWNGKIVFKWSIHEHGERVSMIVPTMSTPSSSIRSTADLVVSMPPWMASFKSSWAERPWMVDDRLRWDTRYSSHTVEVCSILKRGVVVGCFETGVRLFYYWDAVTQDSVFAEPHSPNPIRHQLHFRTLSIPIKPTRSFGGHSNNRLD